MKLERFKETNKKKTGMIIGICFVVLLCTVIVVFRSFALYEEKKEFDVIKGRVPDQNYDVLFAFTLEDEDGNKTNIENVPEGTNYEVTVSCDKGATGEWNYEEWGPLIKNLTNARTKCKINFGPSKAIADVIKNLPIVTEGSGLYEVSHSDAEITYTTELNAINNLKQTEYRYAGANPNNYVNFNNELWRIIGLVNTPEGSRIKLIRNEFLGRENEWDGYSWDSSEESINDGFGINEWSTSKMKELLNNGPYYNRTTGDCYIGSNNRTSACDFSSTGLTNEAKEMIDTVTWNTGSNGTATYMKINSNLFYNLERSSNTGVWCIGNECDGEDNRTTSWVGQVGLMYPSDYGYATSGGSTTNRETCLNTNIHGWSDSDVIDCKENDWLYISKNNPYKYFLWTITPLSEERFQFFVFSIDFSRATSGGVVYKSADEGMNSVLYPVVYLKSNINIVSGNGTMDSPYEISLKA